MIKSHCFSKEWIDGFRKQARYNKIDPLILEKMIQALYLLQNLKTYGLNFTFKGGTSLILLLNNANRFSIDIDIIARHSQTEIEAILDEIIANSRFLRWELDEKRSYKAGVPKAHYRVHFKSQLGNDERHIMLDILFEDIGYPVVQNTPVQTQWIESEEIIEVQTPSIESIAGDKLTAFAPNTTGIPYFKNDQSVSKEIIKQLFDLEKLFDEISEIEVVSESFLIFAEKEINYRSLPITSKEVLQDTIDTCRLITKRGNRCSNKEKADFDELQSGIKSFDAFLISEKFRIDEAILSSAKVAYLAAKILFNELSPLEKYDGQEIKDWNIEDPNWNFLNRLQRQSDKSIFYYWYKTVELLQRYTLPRLLGTYKEVEVIIGQNDQSYYVQYRDQITNKAVQIPEGISPEEMNLDQAIKLLNI